MNSISFRGTILLGCVFSCPVFNPVNAAEPEWKILPSNRVLEEGDYETRGLYSGGAGFFTREAQQIIVRTVKDLAIQAGRKVPE